MKPKICKQRKYERNLVQAIRKFTQKSIYKPKLKSEIQQ